jgi:hypothetical protein
MTAWVLIGIGLTFLLLLLDWFFPTDFFFKLGLKTRDYGAATCVCCAAILHQNAILFHLLLSH